MIRTQADKWTCNENVQETLSLCNRGREHSHEMLAPTYQTTLSQIHLYYYKLCIFIFICFICITVSSTATE